MNTNRIALYCHRDSEPDEFYVSEQGHTIRREDGLTPNGNQIDQRWVLRDKDGVWIDFAQYRYDLFSQYGFSDPVNA